MPPVFIPFDGWSPGGGSFGDGWDTADDLFPYHETWRPWRKFTGSANTVAFGPMTGQHVHIWASGVGTGSYISDEQTVFSGSRTRLFSWNPLSGVGTDISRAAFYGVSDPAGWRFASVGNDIWATNWVDPLQRRTNNAGAFANGCVSTFTPQPRFIATVREFLVGANLSNAGRFQDEIVWSDADNATNFDPPTGTSQSVAGAKRLTSVPGQIMGLVGGQFGLAFKRKAIFYLEYSGSTAGFRPDVLSSTVGTPCPSSIIASEHGVFFRGLKGFYVIRGLSEPIKISPPGIEYFMPHPVDGISYSAINEDSQLCGFTVADLPLVGWFYRGDWTNATNTNAIVYNPETQQWARCTLSPELTVAVSRPLGGSFSSLGGFTWDGSVTKYASLSDSGTAGNIVAPSLALRFRALNLDQELSFRQTHIKSVLPVFTNDPPLGADPLSPTVSIDPMFDPFAGVYGAAESRPPAERALDGNYPFQRAARFVRIRIACAAEDFNSFDGVYVDQELLT